MQRRIAGGVKEMLEDFAEAVHKVDSKFDPDAMFDAVMDWQEAENPSAEQLKNADKSTVEAFLKWHKSHKKASLTAPQRKALVRLASTLPAGDPARRAILVGLSGQSLD